MGIIGRLAVAIVAAVAIFGAVGTASVHQTHPAAGAVGLNYGTIEWVYTQQKRAD
jgi:hypothetical protein